MHRITNRLKWQYGRGSHRHLCNFRPLESSHATRHHSLLTPPAAPSSPTADPSMRVPTSPSSTVRCWLAPCCISNTSIGTGKASFLQHRNIFSYSRRQPVMCGQAAFWKVPITETRRCEVGTFQSFYHRLHARSHPHSARNCSRPDISNLCARPRRLSVPRGPPSTSFTT